MKIHIIAAVTAGLLFSAQGRVWTNTEGKTLEAKLVRVSGDKVYLEVGRARKIHALDISGLSKADQDFVAEYNRNIEERLKQQAVKARSLRWHKDFAEAQAEAEELGYPILFLYTAPSWCGWCRVLEDNVLDKSDFKNYAKENLVFYIADFSDRDEGDEWKEDNADLYKKFPCKGFPCTYIVSPSGEKLGKIGGAEKDWGPKEFIAKIEKFTKK